MKENFAGTPEWAKTIGITPPEAMTYTVRYPDSHHLSEEYWRERIALEIEGRLIGWVDSGTFNQGIIAAVNTVRGS